MLLRGCWGFLLVWFVVLVCLIVCVWFLFVFNSDPVNPVDMLRNSLGHAALNFLCVPELSLFSHDLLSLASLTCFAHPAVGLTIENVFILGLKIAVVLCFSSANKIQG